MKDDFKKVSWNDLQNVPYKEIQKQHKMNTQQMEHAVRRHMDGANSYEREQLYKDVWLKKKE